MALAEKDDYTGVKPCEALAQEYEKAGGKIDVKIYSGASHAFDGDPARTQALFLRSAENYVNCIVYLEDDGSMTYADKRYARPIRLYSPMSGKPA
jgi:dienelactone hydrolase